MAEAYGDLNAELDRLYAARFHDDERESKARLWRIICEAFFDSYVPEEGACSTSAPATATSSTTFRPVVGSPST